jgi:eukaryotic-like serine/threonine-protein kinase
VPLDPQQLKSLSRISSLLDEVMPLAADARLRWLEDLRRTEPEIAAKIAGLLQSHAHDSTTRDVMQTLPRLSSNTGFDSGYESAFFFGQRVGPYALIESVGRGGMGEVWRASRADGAYVREVALKLPINMRFGSGLASIDGARTGNTFARRQLERFEHERDILASLSHDGIARFYDAGIDAGQPYLALELVNGAPIHKFVQSQNLSVRLRLQLFQQVLAAVQFAHSRLVIHRDLKPSNILVDEAAKVKLLDFGIAKMLAESGDESPHDSTLTASGGRALTPGYASPEQVMHAPLTTATDVYSLGVILFELLAGKRPYALARDTPAALEEAILSGELMRLPRKLLGADGIVSEKIDRDLDTVIQKATARKIVDRYATVAELSADVHRVLRREPILAQADSWLYRARKFVRRNLVLVAASTAVGVATVGGVAASLWQAAQVKAEAQRANVIKNFLIGVLSASDPRLPSDKPRGQITARELLDASAEKIDKEFAAYPEVQFDLLDYFADIYTTFSEGQRSDAMREKQRLVLEKHFDPLGDRALDWTLARVNRICSDVAPVGCDRALSDADTLIKQAGKDDSRFRAAWWRYKAIAMATETNALEKRKIAFENSIALFQKHQPNSARYVSAIAGLGVVFNDENDFARAIVNYKRALEVSALLPIRDVHDEAIIASNLGLAYSSMSDFTQAIQTFRDAARMVEKTVGDTNPTSWHLQHELAKTLQKTGQRSEASDVFAKLMPKLPPATQPHNDADRIRVGYGELLIDEGRTTEAITIFEEVERHYLVHMQFEHLLRTMRWSLGLAYHEAGRADDAKRTLKTALDEAIKVEPANDQSLMGIRETYATVLLETGDVSGAAIQFAEVVKQAQGRKLSHVALGHGGLARVAAARKQPAVALRESATALDIWAQKTGFSNGRMEPRLQRMRADALAANAQWDEAQKMEDIAWQAMKKFYGATHPNTARRVMQKI